VISLFQLSFLKYPKPLISRTLYQEDA